MNVLVLLVVVVSVAAQLLAPKPKTCTQPGPLCQTCSNLTVCIETGENTFIQETVETCEQPSRCVDGACTYDTSDPFCSGLADLPFICRTVGIFPDPFYCDRFVMCVKESGAVFTPYVNECEQGFKYNIKDSLCDLRLEDGACREGEYPVPLCEFAGQNGPLEGKPELFYICEEYSEGNSTFYPVLDVCPGGLVYQDYQCVDKDLTTSPATTVPTTSVYTTAPTKPATAS